METIQESVSEYLPAKARGKYKGYAPIQFVSKGNLTGREYSSTYILRYKGIAKDNLDAILYVYQAFINRDRLGTKVSEFDKQIEVNKISISAEGDRGWLNWHLQGLVTNNQEGIYEVEIEVDEFKRGY